MAVHTECGDYSSKYHQNKTLVRKNFNMYVGDQEKKYQ